MEILIEQTVLRWLVAKIRLQAQEHELVSALDSHGFAAHRATALLTHIHEDVDAFEQALLAMPPERRLLLVNTEADDGSAFQATAAFSSEHNAFACEHGAVNITLRLHSPHVVGFANLLTVDECDTLIDTARPTLQRAKVINPVEEGDYVDERRTSELTVFNRTAHPLVTSIIERAATLLGIPVVHAEGIQVMRYGVGAEYQPHFDYFHDDKEGEAAHLKNGGQRIASLVMYLNAVEAGGETVFPSAGLKVAPLKGGAVYFAYTDDNQRCDTRSLHGGLPVLAGEKWIATIWFRAQPYR